ncbi:MAG TPA: restriction endonuclease subunit S [Acidiphilium sp.]|nr:restriction endonuclease subunit S [Acidiphilium sp.]
MSVRHYPAYKPSGIDWIDVLPSHWRSAPVWAVASCNDEVLREDTDPEQTIDYVEISDVNEVEGIRASTEMVFAEAPSRARRVVRGGDVIVSTVRTYLRAIAAVPHGRDGLIGSTGFAVFRPRTINAAYLAHLFHAEYLIAEIISRSTGVSYPAINASTIQKLKVPLPPEPEQRAIAAFLDRETAKIDALIAEQERLIALLQEKRQAVISQAVTKGLDPTVPMKDSGVEWIGLIPAHWNIAALKFLADVQTGLAKGKDYGAAKTVNVPYLRVANVQDGYLNLDDVTTIEVLPEDVERYRLKIGDVLMNEGGDFDKLGRGDIWRGQIDPCIHQNHVFAVRPRNVSSEWLNLITSALYAQQFFISRSKQTTNLASISSTNLMELPVVLPPALEQETILALVEKARFEILRLISASETAVSLLRERRAALISAAVTGKIDVREAGVKPAEAA